MNRKTLFNAAAAASLTLGVLAFGVPGWSQPAAPGRGGGAAGGAARAPAPPPAPPTGKAPIVNVTGGQVQGAYFTADKDVAVYRGIPFAAAPVGDLRWRSPQPVKTWTGVRDGSVYGSTCTAAEDCLYLNVYMPAGTRPGAKLPVMVWIHGGSFTGGSGSIYDGTPYAKRGVVYVSINYRLGKSGWFAHPALTKNAPAGEAVGNYGLQDQIAALQWVQANIAAFGGDKTNVTAFGESAGAISINYLMIVAPTQGLFGKVIDESGFGRIAARALPGAEAQGKAFFDGKNITGDSADTVKAMRAVPWADLQGGSAGVINDGVLVKESTDAAFEAGHEMKVPYLVGGNSNEASLFAANSAPAADRLARITANRDAALAAYDPTGARNADKIIAEMVSDQNIEEPDRALARAHVRNGQTVYRYFYSYLPVTTRATALGVNHGGEITYVFARNAANMRPEDKAISDATIAYWTAFAKTGAPGQAGGPLWPKYDLTSEPVMEFGDAGPQIHNGLWNARLDWMAIPANRAQVSASNGQPGAGRGGAATPAAGGGGRGAGRGG